MLIRPPPTEQLTLANVPMGIFSAVSLLPLYCTSSPLLLSEMYTLHPLPVKNHQTHAHTCTQLVR